MSNTAEKLDAVEPIKSIEPELSDDNPDEVSGMEVKKGSNPVPRGIKLLLAGLAGLVVVVIASVFMFTDDEYEPVVTPSAFIDPVSIANGKNMANTSEGGLVTHQKSTASDAMPELIDYRNYEGATATETEIEPKETVAIKVDEDFNSINSRLDEQASGISQLNETVAQLKNEEFIAFHKQIAEVTLELANIKHLVNKQYAELKKENKRKTTATNRLPVKPPFILVSIDVWGNQENAVLLMQGKTSFAQIGDERAGWKIIRISRPDCIVTESVNFNKQIKLCKKA